MHAVKKILVTFALLLASFSSIAPASAHTEIDHTSPAAGTTVAAGVQTISVEFSDKILDLADSSEIVVTDANGDAVELSCVEVKKTSLNAEVYLATEGEYRVVWRTVAEDGHPITGKFSFNATGTGDKGNFVSCKDLASQGTVVIATPKAEPVQSATTDTGVIWPYWVGGLLILCVGTVVLVRRKSTKA
ncbi:MAG: hypothetical protein RLY83_64 [Actinomycetota bacterium]|jgi:methionine-rich copper-binding protein CopC